MRRGGAITLQVTDDVAAKGYFAMDVTIGQDGTLILTTEMLAHLGVKPGEKLTVTLAANRQLQLCSPSRAPGEKLLQTMLGRTGRT